MDAKNMMDEVTSRISGFGDTYKQGQKLASRAADKARDLYSQAEDQLPEGSMKYGLFALAGLTIGIVSYQLGKSRMRSSSLSKSAQRVNEMTERAREPSKERLSLVKDQAESVAQGVERFDFTPVYKLAKLWLIYKISL